jgi:hypothetical protein
MNPGGLLAAHSPAASFLVYRRNPPETGCNPGCLWVHDLSRLKADEIPVVVGVIQEVVPVLLLGRELRVDLQQSDTGTKPLLSFFVAVSGAKQAVVVIIEHRG